MNDWADHERRRRSVRGGIGEGRIDPVELADAFLEAIRNPSRTGSGSTRGSAPSVPGAEALCGARFAHSRRARRGPLDGGGACVLERPLRYRRGAPGTEAGT